MKASASVFGTGYVFPKVNGKQFTVSNTNLQLYNDML
jgi:hypothetical protein